MSVADYQVASWSMNALAVKQELVSGNKVIKISGTSADSLFCNRNSRIHAISLTGFGKER